MKNKTEQAQVALACLPIPVCWFNEELNFMGGNHKFLALLNLSEEQILGEHFSHVFDSYGLISTISSFIKSEKVSAEFNQSLLLNRKLSHFKFILQKCGDSDRMILLTIEDVSLLVDKNHELETLKAKTTEASRMAILGEMTSGIGHEINNPLTVIMAQTDILRDKLRLTSGHVDAEDFIKRLDRISTTGVRIEKIIRGLRMFSRDSTNDPFQSTLVSELISESMELCIEKLKDQQIRLIIDDIDPGLEIDCRPSQISQILLNLIGNSRDAIASMDEKWIRLQVKDMGGSVQFSLIDSGRGIPENISAKITETFFTTKENGRGTGLGLSITKKIVDSHFGNFYVDRDCPNTKFVFEVPKGLAGIA